jgi:hypothetical protein
LSQAIWVALAGWCAGPGLDLQFHHPLGREGEKLAHEVAVGSLLDQLDQDHPVVGHRRLRSGSARNRTLTEDRR